MSGPIFVLDNEETPLMPIAAARARQLIRQGKARLRPHHAFTVLQLAQPVPQPSLRPVVLGMLIHSQTAELFVLADGTHRVFPLAHIFVDIHTDIPRRIRRRALHRRRRRQRGRYRAPRRYGRPFKHRHSWGVHAVQRQRDRPYRRSNHRPTRLSASPTMHWRAHAIERVIMSLSKLVPISHVVMLDSPHLAPTTFSSEAPAQRRQRLIDTYGLPVPDGGRIAQCAYCGTTAGRIEVEHMRPISRGGTDAAWNLTLACTNCNRRKGDRTPDEAGMVPRFPHTRGPSYPQRAAPGISFTTSILAEKLRETQKVVVGQGFVPLRETLPESLVAALLSFVAAPGNAMTYVAKPISHPRKQVFTARNYALSTPPRADLERVGDTIKRHNRVNLGLVRQQQGKKTTVTVLKAGTAASHTAAPEVIRLGMLCRGKRSGQTVTGIVHAIHSTGKLSLTTPTQARWTGISWQRIVISPRQHLDILSTDRVIFLPVSTLSDTLKTKQEETDAERTP